MVYVSKRIYLIWYFVAARNKTVCDLQIAYFRGIEAIAAADSLRPSRWLLIGHGTEW